MRKVVQNAPSVRVDDTVQSTLIPQPAPVAPDVSSGSLQLTWQQTQQVAVRQNSQRAQVVARGGRSAHESPKGAYRFFGLSASKQITTGGDLFPQGACIRSREQWRRNRQSFADAASLPILLREA
jgi:hypothetical protein